MSALTTEQRQKGLRAMQDKMKKDPAGSVRRRLKAGRPMRLFNDALPVLEAVQRLTVETDRAQAAMHDAGLDPKDISLGLVYTMPERGEFGCKWLPEPGQIGAFVTAFEQIATETQVLFLGVLWHQRDRLAEANGQPGHTLWVTQFMAGAQAEQQLRAVRDFFAARNLN